MRKLIDENEATSNSEFCSVNNKQFLINYDPSQLSVGTCLD